MATRASIEFDFHKAMADADTIDGIADKLSTISKNKFGGTLQNVSASWKGENANLYLKKGERLQENMEGTASELHNIASDIRMIARRLYEAEMAALQVAETRVY